MTLGFPYEELAEAGIEKVVVEYSGSGDEGYINEIIAEPVGIEYRDELYDLIRDVAYDLLEDNYAGWEINEGSQGEITLVVSEQKAYLHHGTIIETTEYEDTVFS